MQSLPYELLQLISNSLLPRYQCRLALASKHNYKYLYNDLLRWHARKYQIPTPECTIVNDELNVRFINNTLYYIIFEEGDLVFNDITNDSSYCPEKDFGSYVCYNKIRDVIATYGIEIFDMYYDYIEHDILENINEYIDSDDDL